MHVIEYDCAQCKSTKSHTMLLYTSVTTCHNGHVIGPFVQQATRGPWYNIEEPKWANFISLQVFRLSQYNIIM